MDCPVTGFDCLTCDGGQCVVLPKMAATVDPMPATHIPGPCPRCGALTVDAAQGLCQPNPDIWGASTCPVQDTPDDDDLIHVINPAWVAWADAQTEEPKA